ncbi:MAG TPA: NADH-quinone oxidoreductase subunit L, partial [Dissulfurispiraceae bacterium]|nr:NADH-quinone oxidoreductase subunit L [Dissulfurispiraceae bacterium]
MPEVTVRICMGTGGIAAGGSAVLDAFQQALSSAEISALFENRCSAHKVGCRGLCAKDVLVDVVRNGIATTYEFVTVDMVERIVAEHIVGGTVVGEWAAGADYHDFLKKQIKVVLADCGKVDPESVDSYVQSGGYAAIRKALMDMHPSEIIAVIKTSGLRGRGGAGFPTGVKWETCRSVDAAPKYIICNADEGDPGAFMDRAVLEGNPHSVIEGMIIGAYAIGANTGYVYVRAEYPLAVKRLRRAIQEAEYRGFLGTNVLGSGFAFSIK